MNLRKLGTVEVGAIGLGEMPLSISGRPDEDRAIATIHAALDAGVTLIDTADAYCLDGDDFGHGEALVARALDAYDGARDSVLVATKGGHTRVGEAWELDGRPEYLAEAARASLRRLGVVPRKVVHPGLLGGWWLSRPSVPRRTPDEVAR